ncbi:MAG TPA: hypothetical protein VMW53_00665 [archaeon]|nr:hypothetical protein [archaeon]
MKGEVKYVGKIVKFPVKEIRLQYLPKISPIWLYPGLDPYRMENLHHVTLLKHIIKHGLDWKKLKKLTYVKERRHRYDIGMLAWTDSHLREHIKRRWKTYRSLKNGWSKKMSKVKPVVLLKKPFIETRYNWESGFLKGPECWDGLGRSSAAFVLGWKEIPVQWAEDAHPGSRQFDKGFNKIKK